MDPVKWGPYGWKMIHAISRVPNLRLKTYRNWLNATSAILPCRKCRNNFRKHIRSGKCDSARSPTTLGICLHRVVSKDLGKPSGKRYTERDLPAPTVQNILQPVFWLAVATNKTLRKKGALHTWFRETENILNASSSKKYQPAIHALRELQTRDSLQYVTETTRQKHLTNAVREMLRNAGISSTRLPAHKSIVRMRSTRRSRPSSRASTKRRHTDARSSRDGTRKRSRATSSNVSSG